MAFSFPVEDAIARLREVVKQTWSIPDYHPIPESGNPAFTFKESDLPMAVLEAGTELSTNIGPAAKDLTEEITYYCWFMRKTTGGFDDTKLMRQDLFRLAVVLGNGDRRLRDASNNQTVSYSALSGIDWSGTARQWPFAMEEGVGVVVGYVGFKMTFYDQ